MEYIYLVEVEVKSKQEVLRRRNAWVYGANETWKSCITIVPRICSKGFSNEKVVSPCICSRVVHEFITDGETAFQFF
jgi:hypothetical protein